MPDREPPPEKVIAWLRTPRGERWSENRITGLETHWDDSGIFGDVISGQDSFSAARWPVPLNMWSLDLVSNCCNGADGERA